MSGLATFTITHKIEGMAVPGRPEGEGDCELTYTRKIDATDLEGAIKAWYVHLIPWFGEEEAAKQEKRVLAMIHGGRSR